MALMPHSSLGLAGCSIEGFWIDSSQEDEKHPFTNQIWARPFIVLVLLAVKVA